MSKTLLLITVRSDRSRAERIIQEWENLGGNVIWIDPVEIVLKEVNGVVTILHPEVTFDRIDAVLNFRGTINQDLTVLTNYLIKTYGAKTITNDILHQDGLEQSMVYRYQQLEQAGINIPPQFYFGSEAAEYAKETCNYPVVLKKLRSARKQSVTLAETKDAFTSKFESIYDPGELYVAKQYIPHAIEWRIVAVNRTYLGGYSRKSKNAEFLGAFKKDAIREAVRKEDEPYFKELVEKICELTDYDMVGIDVIRDHDGRHWVLDVNRYFRFESLEQTTKINVAREICLQLWD